MRTRVYAEYDDPAALAMAIYDARAWGSVRLETYTPYHVPEIERALGEGPSRVGIPVLVFGLAGAIGAYALQWYVNAYDTPLNAGGRPPHFPLSFVPITFEMGVLIASFTALIAVFIGGRLVRLWYASSDVPGIESSTGWRFWLEIELLEPRAKVEELVEVIQRSHPLTIRRMEVP